MAIQSKVKKPKEKTHMTTSKKKEDDQGAFTKKTWENSTTKEKLIGVGTTALAAGALYAAIKA